MKSLSTLFLMAALAVSSSAQAQSVTLQDLFVQALDNNPSLQVSEAERAAAQSQLSAADALHKPEVMLQSELSYAWMKKNNFPRTANQLKATYPLYQPELTALSGAAEFDLQAKQWLLEAQRQDVLRDVSLSFFKVWQQQIELEYLRKEQTSLEEILQQLNQRYEVGYQDLNDLVEVQARLDMNQADRLLAEQEWQQAKLDMLAILGESSNLASADWPLHFPKELPVLPVVEEKTASNQTVKKGQKQAQKQPKNHQAWWFLIENHPVLQALQQQWLAAQQQVDYEKTKDGIEVEAFGALVYNESDGNFYDDMQGARGGLALNIPLYLGGRTDAKVSQQRYQAQKIQAEKQRQALALQAQSHNAWLGVKTGLVRYQALQSALASNRQALAATQEGLKTGTRNILDLLNAQRTLHKTERDLPKLKAQIWQNWYRFYWAIGNLNVET